MKDSKTRLNSIFSNQVKSIIAGCCIALMLVTSCGGSDDGGVTGDCATGLWTQSVQTELDAWVAATQAYGAEATTANCNNYKNAGQAYINALESIKSCVPNLSLLNFEEALEEAKTELNTIPCN